MKRWQFGALAVAVLALGGCHSNWYAQKFARRNNPPFASNQVKGVYTLPTCDAAPDQDTVGTVNIVLPDKFDGSKIDRAVNHGPKEPKGDPNSGVGQSGFGPNKADAPEPFDVFVNWTDFPTHGYLLTRVLLTKGAKFGFYQSGNFFGVGREDPNDGTLCGAAPALSGKNPGQGQAQEIAIFYVDLAKLAAKNAGAGVHFTVGVFGNNGAGSATPILIDPKIINDGGGTRNNPGG
ncbi:MAG: hypothetical protein J2O44_02930 [Porphyrobacter sp.]|nr:hypothetical protein [Porphyrobacter sp.]